MEEFTLINKQRNRIKVFKPFEDISKPSPSINAMEISYGCVYKRSSKPVIKESIRSETIERVEKCKEWTKEAIPKIVLEKTGKPATQEFVDGATKTFGFWWLGTLEQIKRGQ